MGFKPTPCCGLPMCYPLHHVVLRRLCAKYPTQFTFRMYTIRNTEYKFSADLRVSLLYGVGQIADMNL